MYETHFGLHLSPFRLTPDANFFFSSATHKKGLSYLQYGLAQGEGFIVLTGAPGSGKTTLLKKLVLDYVAPSTVVAEITSTLLPHEALLQHLAEALNINSTSRIADLLSNIKAYLLNRGAHGQHVLIIIDEAQNLDREGLESLRMLSNLQYRERAVLQVLLVGQHQLEEALQHPDLSQLRQRILASYRLEKLDRTETPAYIQHRLAISRCRNPPEITDNAFVVIHEYCKGIPRLINRLCDRIFLYSFVENCYRIDEATVFNVISELQQEPGFFQADWSEDKALAALLQQHGYDTPRATRRSTTPSRQSSAAFPATLISGNTARKHSHHVSEPATIIEPSNLHVVPSVPLQEKLLDHAANAVQSETNGNIEEKELSLEKPADAGEVAYQEHIPDRKRDYLRDPRFFYTETVSTEKNLAANSAHAVKDLYVTILRVITRFDIKNTFGLIARRANFISRWYPVASISAIAVIVLLTTYKYAQQRPVVLDEPETAPDIVAAKPPASPPAIIETEPTLEPLPHSSEQTRAEPIASVSAETVPTQNNTDPTQAFAIAEHETQQSPVLVEGLNVPQVPATEPLDEPAVSLSTVDKAPRVDANDERTPLLDTKFIASDNASNAAPAKPQPRPVPDNLKPKSNNTPPKPTPKKRLPLNKPAKPKVASATTIAAPPGPPVQLEAKEPDTTATEAVWQEFASAYEKGDIDALLALLDEDIQTNDSAGKEAFRKDYSKLFNITERRKLSVEHLNWIAKSAGRIGAKGPFEVAIQEKGSRTITTVKGDLELELEKTESNPRITALYFSYLE